MARCLPGPALLLMGFLLLVGSRPAAAHRALAANYAPFCPAAYTATGECVDEVGMVVNGKYRKFAETCKWTLSLVEVGRNAVGCLMDNRSCKIGKLAGPKAAAICTAACPALKSLKNKLQTDADCKDDGKKNGSARQSSSSGSCFPGSALVQGHGGSRMRLHDVHPGQEIAAVRPDGAVEFSQMFMLSAPLPHHRTTFVRLSTEAGFNMTVTPNHYLFSLRHSEASAASLQSLYAWRYTLPTEIRVGDVVPVVHNAVPGARFHPSRVTQVELVEDVGIYMPHTAAGSVLVDGVVATQLTTTAPQWLAHHRVGRPCILALRKILSLLPSPVREAAVNSLSMMVHGVPSGLWAASIL